MWPVRLSICNQLSNHLLFPARTLLSHGVALWHLLLAAARCARTLKQSQGCGARLACRHWMRRPVSCELSDTTTTTGQPKVDAPDLQTAPIPIQSSAIWPVCDPERTDGSSSSRHHTAKLQIPLKQQPQTTNHTDSSDCPACPGPHKRCLHRRARRARGRRAELERCDNNRTEAATPLPVPPLLLLSPLCRPLSPSS